MRNADLAHDLPLNLKSLVVRIVADAFRFPNPCHLRSERQPLCVKDVVHFLGSYRPSQECEFVEAAPCPS